MIGDRGRRCYTRAMTSPLAVGHAPGKIILFGEHAVVYGRPAIAAPVTQVQAQAFVYPHAECVVEARDLHRTIRVAQAPDDDPFALVVRLVCRELDRELPPWRIVAHSDIPVASGLGSGAAIAAAIARALLAGFETDLPPDRLSALVYEVEKLHHGTPSGIDNTVVVYEQPVWFVRGQPPTPFFGRRAAPHPDRRHRHRQPHAGHGGERARRVGKRIPPATKPCSTASAPSPPAPAP